MIKKVLIAEDHESANISLQKTLEEFKITDVDVVYYCDDAFQKVQNGCKKELPYDLLITDLHFEGDANLQKINGGKELISAVRTIQPDLRILVFSAEANPAIINTLFNTYAIDGYVRKARHDAKELKIAISKIAENRHHIPHEFIQAMRQKNAYHLTDFDLTIISLLAKGVAQKNIPDYLKENNIHPSGLSTVEKRLNHIREALDLKKNEQLVLFCKEKGII